MNTDRTNELIEVVQQTAKDAFSYFNTTHFEYLVQNTRISPEKFRKQLLDTLLDKIAKRLPSSLAVDGTLTRIHNIDFVTAKAKARQARYVQNNGQVPPEDLPVHISQLSLQEITECRIKLTRREWLAKLRERQLTAENELQWVTLELQATRNNCAKMQAEADTRMQNVKNKLAQMDPRHLVNEKGDLPAGNDYERIISKYLKERSG